MCVSLFKVWVLTVNNLDVEGYTCAEAIGECIPSRVG